MIITENQTQFKQFFDFQKYARFISEQFDIDVQLDSNKAETDGRTIYIPNVMSMTEKEVDMMYAILLHEAGHIRYSTFDESYFSQLKTEAHAFLANSIEDARIENLLLTDFGGAQDMFESLYNDYLHDKNLMKKVFKFTTSKPDAFTSLAFLLHNKIVKFKTPDLKEICGGATAKKINSFYEQYDIDSLISKNPLKNDSDVIKLTNKVYDLFVAHFSKDTSKKLSFKEEFENKNKIQKALDAIKKKAEMTKEKIENHFSEIETLEEEKQEIYEKNAFLAEEKENQIQNQEQLINKIQDILGWKKSISQQENQKSKAEQDVQSSRSKISELQNDINNLNAKISTGFNDKGKPFTEKQKQRITDQISSKNETIKKMNEKISASFSSIAEINPKIEQLKQNIPHKDDSKLINKTLDELIKDNSEQTEALKELEKELEQINSAADAVQSEIDSIHKKIEKERESLIESTSNDLLKINDSAEDLGVNILPAINYDEAWPEASSAQKSFDEKATAATGKIVRNGTKVAGLFGSNVRDVITFVDLKKEQVVDIDLSTLFKEKIGTSKLSEFNSDIKKTNYEDKSVTGVFGTHREHIPSTTFFDVIKNENTSNSTGEMTKLKSDNAEYFLALKRIISQKFKFAKKDFWRGSQEDGQLDSRSLWKLPTQQGDDYYEINNPKYVNKLAISILIDVSGSQDKEATGFGEKIKALALGLSEAFDAAHIKHEVLGYHAPVCQDMRELNSSPIYTRRSNNLETIVYKTFTQKEKLGLMNIDFHATDNSDGESLRIAMKRLKAVRAKSHAIFIISDGKPFLSDTDMSVLDEDFKSALRQSVREKIHVFGLGFFNQLGEFLGEKFCNAGDEKNVLQFFNKISI